MYLISVEGGDGSGKGLATSIVAEILEKELTEKERVKTWKLKDFYLVYQYHL